MSTYREEELQRAQREISEMRAQIQKELTELRKPDPATKICGAPSFDAVDRNHDGVLDRAEYEAMQAAQGRSRELEAPRGSHIVT